MADILQSAMLNNHSVESLKNSLTLNSSLKKTEVESLMHLAIEFGFLTESSDELLSLTPAGRAFEHYWTAIDKVEMDSPSPPTGTGTELKICVTFPPRWKRTLNDLYGDAIIDTMQAQRMVAKVKSVHVMLTL